MSFRIEIMAAASLTLAALLAPRVHAGAPLRVAQADAHHAGGHGAAPALASGAEEALGALRLSGGWARATPPKAPTGGGYLTIANTGNEDDRLVSAASPRAARVEVHEMRMEGSTMLMRPLGGLSIPAGATVALAPGGLHLMFVDLKDAFRQGETIPVTLVFEKAGQIDLLLPVGAMGARIPPASGATTHGD